MTFEFIRGKIGINHLIVFFIALMGFVVALAARSSWPGTLARYDIMAFVLNATLIVGVIKKREIGFLFLTIVIWIAFFLRASLKVMEEGSSWLEPIGHFDFSPGAWDEVAVVTAVGALAFIMVGLIFPGRIDQLDLPKKSVSLDGYMRLVSWALVIVATLFFVWGNQVFGVLHLGLRPAVELPSPLEGAAVWLITIAPVLGVFVLYYFDVVSRRPLWMASLLFVAIGIAIAYSTASRGAFVIQGGTLLLMIMLLRRQIPWLSFKRLALIIIIFLVGFISSILLAQDRRSDMLPSYDAPIARTELTSIARTDLSFVRRLVVDRWVGLEGLMAAGSYPDKNFNLLIDAIKERRTKDAVDSFTKEISQSNFNDLTRYQYATLPGGFAFLYLSGSLWIVFLGSTLFCLLIFGLERVTMKFTSNPFLAGLFGVSVAMIFIQMGVGVVQQLIVIAFSFIVAVFGHHVAWRILKIN